MRASTFVAAVRDIHVEERLRPIDPKVVARLARSLAREGQLQPIGVSNLPDGPTPYRLEFGLHRLKAAVQIGWTDISATEVPTGHGRLHEIAENLYRADLTPEQKAEHTALLTAELKRRRAEQEQDERARKPGSDFQVSRVGGRGRKGVATEAAEIAGVSSRAIRDRVASVAERAGEPIDLNRDPPERIEAAVAKARTAKSKPKDRAKPSAPKPARSLNAGTTPEGEVKAYRRQILDAVGAWRAAAVPPTSVEALRREVSELVDQALGEPEGGAR